MPDAGQSGWQLYSAQGELIASTLPESWWWELTIPNFRELVAAYKTPTLNIIHKFGHIHVYDMDTRVTYANFDWDGTPLPANLKLHDGRDGVPFLGIHGFDLPIIYAAQQELARAAQSAPQAANSAP